MTSSMPLSFSFFPLHRRRPSISTLTTSYPSPQYPSSSISFICFSSQGPSDYDREESRWLREEQRWLREEQRWLREEKRWNQERQSLLQEISDLRLTIQALESRSTTQETSVSETIASIGSLLQVLKEKSRIPGSGSSGTPWVLEDRKWEEEEKQGKILRTEENSEEETINVRQKTERKTLRTGSQGEEVREMQEALLSLGFYSGEEDMEFSSFSSGTQRAVKTWQATVGVPEDGIMTVELLQRLYTGQPGDGVGSSSNKDEKAEDPTKGTVNGTTIASVTRISETVQGPTDEKGSVQEEYPKHRVFLLGENRWEEPSRIGGGNKDDDGAKTSGTKCVQCRGEGRLMCTECDGTGEPNVEAQFLEWVDEGAKCPYCEGLGYITCDICEGKASL